jgi:hypothetical protein
LFYAINLHKNTQLDEVLQLKTAEVAVLGQME